MYLTRTAGIETVSSLRVLYIILMYLTRTAGIETLWITFLATLVMNVSYPRCGNWNVYLRLCICPVVIYVSYPHCGNWNISFFDIIHHDINNVSYPHCGNWNFNFPVTHNNTSQMYLTRTAGIFAFYSPIKNTSFGGTHRPEWRVFCSFFFILLVYEKKPPSCEEG